MTNREIRQNKEARFSACLRQAAIGTLFERPNYRAPWKPHIRFHKPMYGVLQSSHDDVKYELNKMQRHAAGSKYVIIGGDGLSLMRIDQLLGKHPDVYIDNDRLPMVRLGLGARLGFWVRVRVRVRIRVRVASPNPNPNRNPNPEPVH